MLIYKSKNIITGKSYIGQTTQKFEYRKATHIRLSKTSSTYFHNSLRKYGKENFEWEIIEECNSKEELDLTEEWYIRYYNTYCKNGGYNLTFGGEGVLGYKRPEGFINPSTRPEVRKKISFTVSNNHHMKGKTHTDDAKRKISKASKKMWKDEKHRELISKKLSGKNHPFFGKTHTDDAKKKISEKGRRYYEFTSPLRKKFIVNSSTIQEFCKRRSISYQCMLRNGKSKNWRCISL